MIYARDELRLRDRVGIWGPTICFVLAMIAIAILTQDAMGQEAPSARFDLQGVVVDDATGTPLVGAFVSLTGSEWGSLTDERGRFSIPDLSPGAVSLTSEQLGYESLVWSGDVAADDAALVLSMKPEPILLEGLRVVTDRFRSRRNRTAVSVYAYDREDLATSPRTTLLDFVAYKVGSSRARCSGLTAGDICFRLRGRTVAPVVYVDEVPVLAGLDYLDTLAPQELQMVEIYASGRQIRAYTTGFMERAAKTRLQPIALLF
jgi:Carboxypeptidase regulatory-like domain